MRRLIGKMDLQKCLTFVFTLGIAVGLLGRQLSHGDNRNYRELQPELKAPDVIDTVLYDPDLKQLYVCYDDANQVDVYSENGSFLWAVATPYMRNTDFLLRDGNLYLYGNGEAYIYRAADGRFVEHLGSDGLELPKAQTDQCPEDLAFSGYRVWRALEEGGRQILVNRPWWHRIFDFMLNWYISMVCAAGMGITSLLDRAQEWKRVKNRIQFSTNRSRRLHGYYRWNVWVLFCLTLLEFLLAVMGVCPIFVLFPVTGCFIISSIFADGRVDWSSLLPEEEKAILFWRACYIGAYILLFVASIGSLILWDALRK